MEHRTLGRTGMSVSVLGFGGSEIGYRGASEDTVSRLLNGALDAGLNAIDTAECYLNSEELIGRTVSHRRKDFFLFTKVGHEHGWGRDDWSAASIARSIDRSLKRLRTEYVDLVQLHSCGVDVLEKGEAAAALARAREQGKTRFIGYSGDDRAGLWAVRSGIFDTLQTSISIADQQAIDLLLPIAREKNLGVIAKRPIANAAWRDAEEPPRDAYHHEYWRRLKILDYDFLKEWDRSPDAASISLRFTLAQPGVHTAIVGTQNPDRWKQNVEMLRAGPLPQARIDAIRSRWRAVAKPDWVGQV